MAKITSLEQLTTNKFLNLFHAKGVNDKGHESNYFVASRNKDKSGLMITTHENVADGVGIYALYGEKRDKVVMVRQYRYPIDGYIYEFPAGLCEKGEDYREAAVRELHEETGLNFHPLKVDKMYEAPRFSSVGMTDESVAMVFGYADGEITDKYQEPTEEIQVVLADKDEVRRILKEEHVAMPAAMQLYHFLADDDPFAFLNI
jgi:ADP-ribose pyrophosphatase